MEIQFDECVNMAHIMRRLASLFDGNNLGAANIKDAGKGGKALRRMMRGELNDAIYLLKKMDKPE